MSQAIPSLADKYYVRLGTVNGDEMSEQNEASLKNQSEQKSETCKISSIATSSESAAYMTQSVLCAAPLRVGTNRVKE